MFARYKRFAVRLTNFYTICFTIRPPRRCRLYVLLGVILLIGGVLRAQFREDFSDPDLTTGVPWQGDIDLFTVTSEMLQLQAPEAGGATLSTGYVFTDSIEFGVDVLLQFAPSADNQLRIFLYHQNLDVTTGEALYLELGESGTDDAFTLYHRDLSGTEIDVRRFESIPHGSSLSVTVHVLFKGAGNWTISFDHDGDGIFEDSQEFIYNFSPSPDGFLGLGCRYTSTRTDKFFFDNVFVEKIVPDRTAPVLMNALVVTANKIILNFDEAIDGSLLDVSQFNVLPGNITPSNVSWSAANEQQVCVEFASPLINQETYQISVTDIRDGAGNISGVQSATFSILVPETFEIGDMIINEIHAAPNSTTLVANTEFIELFNRSDKILNIGDLTFRDATAGVSLPDYIIFPGEYITVCDIADVALFTFTDTVVGVSNFPSLNNGGDRLSISDGSIQIDQVEYNLFWYGDADKSSGWSLECKNPDSECRGLINWTASVDASGGTPGEENSVFTIEEPAGEAFIKQIRVFSPNDVGFVFNIEMNESQLQDLGNINIDPILSISSAAVVVVNGEYTLRLNFIEDMQFGQVYRLILNTSICACNGQKWDDPYVYKFGLHEAAGEGDVKISEILFSPFSGESEYLEIVNTSQKIININSLWLHFKNTSQTIRQIQLNGDFQLFPDEYHVLTPNPISVLDNYSVPFPSQVHQVVIPSLSNSGGFLNLFAFNSMGDSVFIDRGLYSDALHDPLLDMSNGVSLERLSLSIDGYEISNWYSASTFNGGGTPTGENSQRIVPGSPSNQNFSLLSPTFSPDGDGFEDLMVMQYELDRPGFVAQATVYSYDGALIRKLINNASLGSSGQIIWNGLTEDGDRARIGIYYVLIEAFHSDGETLQEKKKIVLARQL